MRLVLATSNQGKVRELTQLLSPWSVQVLPMGQFTSQSPAETGLSFVENAILKARFAASAAQLPAIADDSGIEVDALHGAPGIYSARYAGADASDEANLQKLLRELDMIENSERTARYWCAMVFMRHATDPAPVIAQAAWEGRIARVRRGNGGFGYDPIFEVRGMNLTAAELSSADKNNISHRGRATRALLEQLRTLELLR